MASVRWHDEDEGWGSSFKTKSGQSVLEHLHDSEGQAGQAPESMTGTKHEYSPQITKVEHSGNKVTVHAMDDNRGGGKLKGEITYGKGEKLPSKDELDALMKNNGHTRYSHPDGAPQDEAPMEKLARVRKERGPVQKGPKGGSFIQTASGKHYVKE